MAPAPVADTVGCDIGGSNIKLIVLRKGRLSRRQSFPSPADAGKRAFLDTLTELLRPLPESPLGIALPGFLDGKLRRIVHLSNLPQLDGLRLAARLEGRLKRKVFLEADSNAGAMGEARLGAGRKIERLLYLTMGTGLGAALTIKGFPARVSNNTVGQVGGLPICSEKGRGAEDLLCAAGILHRFQAQAKQPAVSSTLELLELAQAGNAAARASWRRTGELLAELLDLLVPLLRPDGVIIGGGVAGASEFFLPAAREALQRRLKGRGVECPSILESALGAYSGAAGAALGARDAS
ncbi:MAG: ROK family protein [Planctomycetota bacterium]|nr:ROK family protein [Planctomycetota bacterium]